MKTTSMVLAGAALLTAVFGTRTASANLITNGSLELSSPIVTGSNSFLIVRASPTDTTSLPGWSITGNIDVIPSTFWQASNGNDSVDMIGSTGLGAVAQTVSGLTIGATYGLSFDLAVNPDAYQGEQTDTKQLQVTVTSPTAVSAANQTFQRTNGAATRLAMNYASEFLTFTATSTTETLKFAALTPLNLPVALTASTAACGPVLDNVDLEFVSGTGNPSGQVPEPASLGVLAAGAMLLVRRRSAR